MDRIYRTSADVQALTMRLIQENKQRFERGDYVSLDLKKQMDIFSQYPITPVVAGLVTILGFTGNAKTTFAKCIINSFMPHLQNDDDIIVYINYEESLEELGLKDVTRMAMIDQNKLIRGEADNDEMEIIMNASVEEMTKPIWTIADSMYDTDYKPQPNLNEIAEQLMFIRKYDKKRIRLVVIDYFQLIPLMIHNPSREGFSQNARILQRLGNIVGCPILNVSQTKRESRDRSIRIPKIDDGGESSSIEQSSRAVWGVYLPWTDKDDLGGEISINNKSYPVTPELFVVRNLKQKHNPVGMTTVGHMDFKKLIYREHKPS